MNLFTARIRIKIIFVKKIDIHFSQGLRNSNTIFYEYQIKSKFSLYENHPFPCSDLSWFLEYIRFDNFDYIIKCKIKFFIVIILANFFEMSTIKSNPLSPSE